MKKAAFPKVIQVGHTMAKIYKTPSHGCDSFTVVWFEGEVRKRKTFASLTTAELHATTKINSLSRGEAEIIQLSGEDRLAYVRAKNVLSEFDISLDSIAFEYRDAKRLAKGKSLVDVAQYYAQRKLRDIPQKTVAEVLEEMLREKRNEGLSERYLEDLRNRGGRFAKDFRCNLTSVHMDKIKEWLQAMTVVNRTRNNFRLTIQTLFAFAKSKKYLPDDWREFESVPLWKTKKEEVEIFTPSEMAKLLSVADSKIMPFLSIGAFAGLRSAEISRLDWSKVNLKTGYITVDASIAKTNSRRLVPIQPNLKAWLKPHAKTQGLVVELENIPNALQRLIDATRPNDPKNPKSKLKPAVEWRHNALRHSFCSYRLAKIKNTAEVALEAGNSPQMIFQHYRELVTQAEAKKWFSILPTRRAKNNALSQMQSDNHDLISTSKTNRPRFSFDLNEIN
jgi:integrase